MHWGGQSWGQALFSSMLAVWRCTGVFFLYGLGWAGAVMAFALLSALVFGLLGLGQAAGVLAVPAGLVFSAVLLPVGAVHFQQQLWRGRGGA